MQKRALNWNVRFDYHFVCQFFDQLVVIFDQVKQHFLAFLNSSTIEILL